MGELYGRNKQQAIGRGHTHEEEKHTHSARGMDRAQEKKRKAKGAGQKSTPAGRENPHTTGDTRRTRGDNISKGKDGQANVWATYGKQKGSWTNAREAGEEKKRKNCENEERIKEPNREK